MAQPKRKGARIENELANILWELGYAVVRGPASGSKVKKRIQPDLVAIKRGIVIVIEVKSGKPGSPIYIPSHQITAITEFARRAGGRAYVAVKIKGDGWRLHEINSIELTPGGNGKIERPESGIKPSDLDEILFPKSRRITEFI